jgi:ATP-dependent DNA helicase RecQ
VSPHVGSVAAVPPIAAETPSPPRPSPAEVADELAAHVRTLAGEHASPHPEQLAAVTAVVAHGRRTLLVARTGFGKSAVYFSATRMLRDRGWGPTVVVSPLLALMRDQVSAAGRLALVAETINSSNTDEWDRIEGSVAGDDVDLLLISPERLANAGFRERVFDLVRSRPMALVCDEAHCISDWGHDFRPDYLRLRHLLDELPAWTPVLATTATANQRVTDDVAGQLGADTLVLRTSLDREALHLSVVDLPDDAHRLAWVGEHLADLPGSGIIYCLTQEQAAVSAEWLRRRGHDVETYTGATEPERRLTLEEDLRANRRKALVATSALGMGFDKGDLAFCIHLGLPPTPVAYYQQIGRAGRALHRAEVVALPRPAEDAAIWRWFEQVSLPAESTCEEVLCQLSPSRPTSVPALEADVNLGRSRLQTLLKILEVDGAIRPVKGGYLLSDDGWVYDSAKAERLRALRREEADQMLTLADRPGCRLRFLREVLDDPEAADCGRCDRCTGREPDVRLDPGLVDEAARHLRSGDVGIEPRRQWPSGLEEPKGRIAPPAQASWGRSLCRLGDGGWAPVVEEVLAGRRPLDAEVVRAVGGVMKRWDWDRRPAWICPMPSRRRQEVIDRLSTGLGQIGRLPVHHALVRTGDGGFQPEQANSAHGVSNLWGRLGVDRARMPTGATVQGPVLLVDDECDSRWTVTVAAHLLHEAGAGPVLPVVLRAR